MSDNDTPWAPAFTGKKKRQEQVVPLKPDKYLRCDCCASQEEGFGVPRVGTILVKEYVRVKREGDQPNEAIGSVIRCGNASCTKTPVITLWKNGREMGIEPNSVFRLVKECRGVATFTLVELYSGQLAEQEIPESIRAMIKDAPVPTFSKPYNPDAHIESMQPELTQEVPL